MRHKEPKAFIPPTLSPMPSRGFRQRPRLLRLVSQDARAGPDPPFIARRERLRGGQPPPSPPPNPANVRRSVLEEFDPEQLRDGNAVDDDSDSGRGNHVGGWTSAAMATETDGAPRSPSSRSDPYRVFQAGIEAERVRAGQPGPRPSEGMPVRRQLAATTTIARVWPRRGEGGARRAMRSGWRDWRRLWI